MQIGERNVSYGYTDATVSISLSELHKDLRRAERAGLALKIAFLCNTDIAWCSTDIILHKLECCKQQKYTQKDFHVSHTCEQNRTAFANDVANHSYLGEFS